MTYEAKYIGKVHQGWQHTELFYKYRGYNYSITVHNNGYMDDKGIKEMHRIQQNIIDERIEHKDDPIPEWKYEGSAQEAFDLFYDSYC